MNHFTLIDRSPWLSVSSIGKYLDLKSPKTIRKFIEEHKDVLEIRIIGGGQKPRIRVKQSSIDRALSA